MNSVAPFIRKAGKATALLALFATVTVYGQTTPAKPQLPTAPSAPAPTPPKPVIIQPDTATKPPVKKREPAPVTKEQAEKAIEKEQRPKERFGQRLVFGGGGGLQFGDITMIDLSPMVGYRFSDRIVAGPGVVYQYLNFRNYGSYHTYGGSLFGRVKVYENFFGHTEYELVNMPKITYDQVAQGYYLEDGKRMNISSFLVGGGYRFMLGERSSLDALLLLNLLDPGQGNFQRYSNPVIRIGFSGGW